MLLFKEFLKEKLAQETNKELIHQCYQQVLLAYSQDKEVVVTTWNGFKILAFSGTRNFLDVKFDLTTGETPISENEEIKVWTGFYKKMQHLLPLVEKEIEEWKKEDPSLTHLVFTGHSLGASVAEIFFLKFNNPGKLFVFGSPLTGNEHFFKALFSGTNAKENVHFIIQKNIQGGLDPITKFPHSYKNSLEPVSDFIDYIYTHKTSLFNLIVHSSKEYAKNISKVLNFPDKE